MAKPGSNGARQIAARGRARDMDLSRLKMTDEEALEIQERLELSNGLRCNGCGRRIGVGFQFTSIAVREEQPILKLAACSRDDCDYGKKCREGGTFVEMVEYVWCDEAGVDAPAAKVIAERIAKKAEQERLAAGREARAAQSG